MAVAGTVDQAASEEQDKDCKEMYVKTDPHQKLQNFLEVKVLTWRYIQDDFDSRKLIFDIENTTK